MAWPNFSKLWLGQSFAAGPVFAGLIMLDRFYGWVILAGHMAGSLIGPAIFFIIKYAILEKTLINDFKNGLSRAKNTDSHGQGTKTLTPLY